MVSIASKLRKRVGRPDLSILVAGVALRLDSEQYAARTTRGSAFTEMEQFGKALSDFEAKSAPGDTLGLRGPPPAEFLIATPRVTRAKATSESGRVSDAELAGAWLGYYLRVVQRLGDDRH